MLLLISGRLEIFPIRLFFFLISLYFSLILLYIFLSFDPTILETKFQRSWSRVWECRRLVVAVVNEQRKSFIYLIILSEPEGPIIPNKFHSKKSGCLQKSGLPRLSNKKLPISLNIFLLAFFEWRRKQNAN